MSPPYFGLEKEDELEPLSAPDLGLERNSAR